MKAHGKQVGLFLVLAIVPVQEAARAAYQTGFEPPTYSVGSVNGQDGWVVNAGSATVQTNTVRTGVQALQVSADSLATRPLNETGEVVWVESYLRAVPSSAPAPDTSPRSASIYFDQAAGIMCLNGNGSGGGTWVPTGVAATAGTWYRVTVRLDFATKTWDCHINGTLRLTNLGFKDNSVSSLNGMAVRAQTGGTTHLDDVLVASVPPAGIPDADSDGLPDSVESANPATAGMSNRFLADSDLDGLRDAREDTNRNGALDSGETSTRNRDSDADGFHDGIEVIVLASNPLGNTSPGGTIVDVDKDSLPASVDPNDNNRDVDGDRIDDAYEWLRLGQAAMTNNAVRPPLCDVNRDGFVSNLDALVIQSLFLSIAQFGNFPGSSDTDPNGDGSVSNVDALIAQSFFLGNLATLPLRQ